VGTHEQSAASQPQYGVRVEENVFVPVRDGYLADFTRMYALGPVDAGLLRVHDAALRVQEAAYVSHREGRRVALSGFVPPKGVESLPPV